MSTTTDTATAPSTADTKDSFSETTLSKFLIKVSEDMPTLDECYKFCNDPSCGAISTFIGTTRDNFNNKEVIRLSYEGYVPMAEKELRKLCEKACSLYDLSRVAMVHKLGDCPVGEASVVIVCSSPHRRDSLDAVSFLIDALKATVPIWKREVYAGDEGSVWKENVEWREGKAMRVMVKEDTTSLS
uniref:Molybdopterin synthase catalytic subunit n=1 Tax=Leptocylindrus danicus TaxID=163516 RepID=A0A7S2KH14_9STRA|mmetsp:Transcript_22254/g.33413  ORF Transcript_22254/g.33413 Transcript_22254/m.33413 type:complete len:186 (+) Transcript_22254:214-771(+)